MKKPKTKTWLSDFELKKLKLEAEQYEAVATKGRKLARLLTNDREFKFLSEEDFQELGRIEGLADCESTDRLLKIYNVQRATRNFTNA